MTVSDLRRWGEFVPARWLVAGLGLALGLFVARVAYELWPGRLAALGFWPVGPALACGVAALAVALYRLWGSRIGLSVFAPWALLLLYVLQPTVNLLQAAVLLAGAAALSLMFLLEALGAREWHMRWGARAVLGAAVLALYLPTMGRTVGEADTFEFQVVAPALGVAHPTGYPLYILLGKLFSLFPVGEVAWRVNLTSVACAVAAIGAVYSLIGITRPLRAEAVRGEVTSPLRNNHSSGRAETGDHSAFFPALVAALALAVSPVFWSQAIVAEVYALNAAFVALLLWLALRGLRRRQSEAEWDARRWLWALALIYGLSLTNHLTMALLAPGLALVIGWVRPRASRADWLKAAGLFALGLCLYLYIPIRWPALNNGQWMPLSDFIGWITGRAFGGALQPGLWRDPTRWRILARLLLEACGPVGAALAALGLTSLALYWRRAAVVTGLAFAAYGVYALVYNVPDISVFLIPAHLIMAVWMGVGMGQIAGRRWRVPGFRLSVSRLDLQLPDWNLKLEPLSLLFVLLPLSLAWTNLPRVDQSQAGQDMLRWGQFVLSLPLPRQAAILADGEKIAPLYYLKSVEGVRDDLDMLVMGTEELYRAELDKRVAQGQPVYLARFLPGLAGAYRLHSVGPLVRVSTTPQAALPLAPITRQLDVSFGQKVNLLGYDWVTDQAGAHHVTLYWQARSELATNYHVRLQLASEAGLAWWEDPGTHPAGGYNPTVAWWPGEVVSDYHEIPAASGLPPGKYSLQVGLFVPFGDEGLEVDGSAGQVWYDVAQVDLEPTEPAALPLALRANFGGQVLLRGASLPGVVPPGGRSQVTLEWETLAPAGDYVLQLTVARADGRPARIVLIKPYAGEYLLPNWTAGRRMQMPVRFLAPAQTGSYTLRVGWIDASNRWVAARCGWMGGVASECPVATLRVEGAPRETGINFADQVILVRSQVGSGEIRPGETLPVELRWQGLAAWPADYTVFVHLIGPDGQVHGQVDAYPVQGTLPTTQWKPGQIVDDPYAVTLAPDAPPGEYQVEVGWYLLATLRRLSVLDSAGRPVDDRVIIGTLNVAAP